MKKATLLAVTAAAAVALSLSVSPMAGAHTLQVKESRNATFNVARVECERLRTCERYGAQRCRVRNQHKVVCGAFLEGTNPNGAYRCTFPVTVSIKDGSNQRYVNPGNVRCHAI